MTSKESGGAVACKEISEKKLAANRRNAQRSTGPKTPAGKSISKWNSIKHGLLAKSAVISECEDQEKFEHLLLVLRAELQPCSIVEEMLVERIAYEYWYLGRIAELKRAHMTNWLKSNERLYTWYELVLGAVGVYAIRLSGELDNDKVSVSMLEDAMGWAAKMGLLEAGVCDNKEALTMSNEEAFRRYQENTLKSLDQLTERFRAALRLAGGIPITDTTLQKLYRYETAALNKFFKALHELERRQRLRGGQSVPPPLILESSQQG